MRYLSLFSGIEAASVAWGPLGWEPMAFAEIDPFPCAVLEERYPGVPNLGDVSQVDWRKFVKGNGKPDVLVGGSPCQSFSIAGSRTGLDGASGLMWEYVRAVREVRPRWVLWENVPGALSSSHGEDFRCYEDGEDQLFNRLADLIDRPAIKPEPSGRSYWRCPRCGAFNYRSAVTDCCGVIRAHYCANCGAEVKYEVD